MWGSLDGTERHRLAAQIFAKAGISDWLRNLDERYPRLCASEASGIPERFMP